MKVALRLLTVVCAAALAAEEPREARVTFQ